MAIVHGSKGKVRGRFGRGVQCGSILPSRVSHLEQLQESSGLMSTIPFTLFDLLYI